MSFSKRCQRRDLAGECFLRTTPKPPVATADYSSETEPELEAENELPDFSPAGRNLWGADDRRVALSPFCRR